MFSNRLALIVRDMTLAIDIDKGVANFWALRGKALFSQDRLPEAISGKLYSRHYLAHPTERNHFFIPKIFSLPSLWIPETLPHND